LYAAVFSAIARSDARHGFASSSGQRRTGCCVTLTCSGVIVLYGCTSVRLSVYLARAYDLQKTGKSKVIKKLQSWWTRDHTTYSGAYLRPKAQRSRSLGTIYAKIGFARVTRKRFYTSCSYSCPALYVL